VNRFSSESRRSQLKLRRRAQQRSNSSPHSGRFARVEPVPPGITVALRRTRRLTTVHATAAIGHRHSVARCSVPSSSTAAPSIFRSLVIGLMRTSRVRLNSPHQRGPASRRNPGVSRPPDSVLCCSSFYFEQKVGCFVAPVINQPLTACGICVVISNSEECVDI
jgi:hypothetical protein